MAAVAAALAFALDQEGPASPMDTAISDSVVALCFSIPKGRASSTAFATVASSGRIASSAPGQEDPASPGDSTSADFVETLWFAIPRTQLHQQTLRLQ